jgi:hypothetical protein
LNRNTRRAGGVAGYVKAGYTRAGNGGRRIPQKADHYEITTKELDSDGTYKMNREVLDSLVDRAGKPGSNVTLCGGCDRSRALGYEDGLPTRLGVYLPLDEEEIVWRTELQWFRGRTKY